MLDKNVTFFKDNVAEPCSCSENSEKAVLLECFTAKQLTIHLSQKMKLHLFVFVNYNISIVMPCYTQHLHSNKIFRNFLEHLFWQDTSGGCFWPYPYEVKALSFYFRQETYVRKFTNFWKFLRRLISSLILTICKFL